MVAMLVLSAVLSAQDPPVHHVRASDAKVAALLNAGMSHSTTFREIVDTLDRSDVVFLSDEWCVIKTAHPLMQRRSPDHSTEDSPSPRARHHAAEIHCVR